MASKGVVISVVAAAIAAGTYLVLEHTFPHHKEEAKPAPAVTVDQVFAGSLKPAAPPTEVASAPESPTGEKPPAPPATGANPEPTAPAETEAPAPAPAETQAEISEPAAEPAKPEPAKPEPMPEPKAEVAPKPAATPKAEPPPKAAEPPPAPKPEPKPEPKPAEPAPSTPAVAAAPKPAPKPAAPKAPAKAAGPVKPWWGPERADKLSLVYVGSAAYKHAVVLMFNSAFDDAASANKNVQVQDAGGKPVKGSWELGNNKRMLVFGVPKPGSYKVVAGAGLADPKGRTLGATQQGPVQVQ